MSLVSLLIAVLILGLILYAVNLLPIQQPFKSIALVIVVIIAILWLAQSLGGLHV